MRADRLVSTLLVMQARGRVTAAELAGELEISVATARRDLEALSGAGIPVYPQAGRNGGWQLIGGARTDLTGLTAIEARALFLLIGPAASASPETKSALRKLVQALPETFRKDAEAAADSVVIDAGKWGRAPSESPAWIPAIEDAVIRRHRLRITYRGWDREPQELMIDPWGLVEKNQVWYLLAGVAGEPRMLRVERIEELSVSDEPADRPADFDLAHTWDRLAAEVETVRGRVSATILADREVIPYLREVFGDQLTAEEESDRAEVRLRVSAQTETLLARRLSSWGDSLRVVEPDSVRAELARIALATSVRNSA